MLVTWVMALVSFIVIFNISQKKNLPLHLKGTVRKSGKCVCYTWGMHSEKGNVRGPGGGAGFCMAVLIWCFVKISKWIRNGLFGFIRLFVVCYVVSEVIWVSVGYKGLLCWNVVQMVLILLQVISAVTWNNAAHSPWRWRQNVSQKPRNIIIILHDSLMQETIIKMKCFFVWE